MIPSLFALNERVVLMGGWPEGFFSLTAVGAYLQIIYFLLSHLSLFFLPLSACLVFSTMEQIQKERKVAKNISCFHVVG